MLSVIVRIVVTAATLFLATSCKDGKTAAAPKAIKSASEYFTISVGDQPVRMQLAVEQPNNMRELSRGLMGRRDLAEDQGMIFVYQYPQRMGFYMRNTPLPLDIGFFTKDGVLREVRQMFPFDETSVTSARTDIHYALEMNQGWFERHGVKPAPSMTSDAGAKLDLKALGEALEARGFKPENYGLRDEAAR
ncbi:hypothetical protein CKA38_04010 [Ereboglobus luteus]|uniref:DUF192 domain-containing protein n=2 Tax=Ereboglobus luteus TaxID=1796921 RepID=A0A2U8E7C1_9BACT|nr:hypothetical protein CKA38_04010 [Ereboglobus luteus]